MKARDFFHYKFFDHKANQKNTPIHRFLLQTSHKLQFLIFFIANKKVTKKMENEIKEEEECEERKSNFNFIRQGPLVATIPTILRAQNFHLHTF